MEIFNQEFVDTCRGLITHMIPGWTLCSSVGPDDLFTNSFPIRVRIRSVDNIWQKEVDIYSDNTIQDVPNSLRRVLRIRKDIHDVHAPVKAPPPKPIAAKNTIDESNALKQLRTDLNVLFQKYQHFYSAQQLLSIADEILENKLK